MVSVIHTHRHTHCRHTCTYKPLEDSCETPRAVKAKKGWRHTLFAFIVFINEMTLHDWGHRVMYVFYQRLTRKLSSYYPCEVWKKEVVCVWVCEHPAPLPLWPQRSCVNTHLPTHPLTSACVRDTEKWSVSMLERWTKGGKEVVSWGTWGRREKKRERRRGRER